MRNRANPQISMFLAVIVSVITVGLSSWPAYAQEPETTPLPQAETTSTPDPTNNPADEEGDVEPSMQDMNMDNADWMQRMVRHCEMMAMMMQMMMDDDDTEQDMQGMMDDSDSMGESTDGDVNPEQDMMRDSHMMMQMMTHMMMGDSDMMNMMMGGSNPDEDATSKPDMHGMSEGN